MKTEVDHSIETLQDLKRKLAEAKSDQTKGVINSLINEKKADLRWLSYNLLYQLGRIQCELGDLKIEMIDYSTTFDIHESVNHVTYELKGSANGSEEIMMFYITRSDRSYIEDLSTIRKRVQSAYYFNLKDVVINDFKKPSYLIESKIAESKLKKLELVKNNQITELMLLVRKIYCSQEELNGFKGVISLLKSISRGDYDGDYKKEVIQFCSKNEVVIRNLQTTLETEFNLV
jgi:hypothetical protein